ncbi:AraC family transcriptional regulator [Amycolatopsis rhabdoformis]|uniref:AraC family transcriptional regulator n=1 Tax=Amycolatopsis rhabdoformis TaxID=1448059 RepID=A0ABZ1I5A5_9PSEU|nr:AraC family transcriptional regulator [Amycolatopsis rhabdoformis]WSE29565.1 AraC family transcriptional regulator [Amycolatopsis rhabdoformis]
MSERSELVLDRPDPLADVLSMADVRPALPARLTAGGEWAVRFGGSHPKVITVTAGSCWLLPEDGAPVALSAGDTYLVGRDAAYTTASTPDVAPIEARKLFTGQAATVGSSAETSLVGATLDFADPAAAVLLEEFGSSVRITDPDTAEVLNSTLRLLAFETAARPGGGVMREHLTQVLSLHVLRSLLAPDAPPAWLTGAGDTAISAALAAIHRRPAFGWTVARLAAEAGLSRTVFATRFKALVGLSPMDYLLHRRISGATRDLAEGRTVASVAARWGYGSESAFSAAFKRVTGRSPAGSRTR